MATPSVGQKVYVTVTKNGYWKDAGWGRVVKVYESGRVRVSSHILARHNKTDSAVYRVDSPSLEFD